MGTRLQGALLSTKIQNRAIRHRVPQAVRYFTSNLNPLLITFRLTKNYVEGLAWVLRYYYQGVRFVSFQSTAILISPPDTIVAMVLPISFCSLCSRFRRNRQNEDRVSSWTAVQTFRTTYGCFPSSEVNHPSAAKVESTMLTHLSSRQHIPEVFHRFMVDEDSPIIDFYPSTFQIDMNGKKMAWQGVALLPFIDEKRLLDAMALEYPHLSEEEQQRNRWGNNVIFAPAEHPVYPFYEALYGKRKSQDVSPTDCFFRALSNYWIF